MDDDRFVGDGFPVPPHTCLRIPRDGKPVPYEQMTKEARNSIGNPIPKE